jgi:hypothetical protein
VLWRPSSRAARCLAASLAQRARGAADITLSFTSTRQRPELRPWPMRSKAAYHGRPSELRHLTQYAASSNSNASPSSAVERRQQGADGFGHERPGQSPALLGCQRPEPHGFRAGTCNRQTGSHGARRHGASAQLALLRLPLLDRATRVTAHIRRSPRDPANINPRRSHQSEMQPSAAHAPVVSSDMRSREPESRGE